METKQLLWVKHEVQRKIKENRLTAYLKKFCIQHLVKLKIMLTMHQRKHLEIAHHKLRKWSTGVGPWSGQKADPLVILPFVSSSFQSIADNPPMPRNVFRKNILCNKLPVFHHRTECKSLTFQRELWPRKWCIYFTHCNIPYFQAFWSITSSLKFAEMFLAQINLPSLV